MKWLGGLIIMLFLFAPLISASWWNTTWAYRVPLSFNNNNGNLPINQTINITYNSATPISDGKLNANCSDIRFTLSNQITGTEVALQYWLYADDGIYGNTVGKCSGSGNLKALAYVNLPSGLDAGSQTIYQYYGYANATSISSANKTMFLADYQPFAGTVNISRWYATSGSTKINNSEYSLMYDLDGQMNLNNTAGFYTTSFLQANKSIILMLRVLNPIGTQMIQTTGSDGYAVGPIGTSFRPVKLDFNTSRATCTLLDNGLACTTLAGPAGSPDSTPPTLFGLRNGWGTSTDFRIANITIGSYLAKPLDFTFGTEEQAIKLIVRAYDISTLEQIYFNATMSNSTATMEIPKSFTFTNLTGSNYPSGFVTFNLRNASYYPLTLFDSIDLSNTETISAYLLPVTTSTIRSGFHLQSYAGISLVGATVTAKKLIGSSYVTSNQCLTDSTGSCYFYLESSTTYQMTYEASGYTTRTENINPALDFTVVLQGGSNPTYQPTFEQIFIYFSPDSLNASENWTIINFTIFDGLGELTLWGLNITYGGAITYSSQSTGSSGGSTLINVSTLGRTNNVTAIAFWKKAAGDVQVYYKYYFIGPAIVDNIWSLTNLRSAANSGGGGNSLVFVALLLAMLATAFATRFVPVVIGGGIVAVVALFLFLPFAVGEGYLLAIVLPFLGLIAFALIKIKGRI